MLTTTFFTHLADALHRAGLQHGTVFMAVGRGQAAWDTTPPQRDRSVVRLVSEAARVAVKPSSITFLDADGVPSEAPTPLLTMTSTFPPGSVTGIVRECGLFVGPDAGLPNAGTLLAYLIHARENHPASIPLIRTMTVDLTPGVASPGSCETRYLGNSSQRELHDLVRKTPRCQIDEIPIDRRFYFGTIEQATAMNYDFCAYCFGREASKR